MLEYSTWLSRQVGKYEDGSIVDNKSTLQNKNNNSPLTPMQVRVHFADLLVPNITEDTYELWVNALSLTISDFGESHATGLDYIIGQDKAKDYYSITDEYILLWIGEFRQDVLDGWEPCL